MDTDDQTASLSVSYVELARERFVEFLGELAARGTTQQQLAAELGVAPQYITDIKSGRRTVSELFARRLEDTFRRSRDWFLGVVDDPHAGAQGAGGFQQQSGHLYLPVFRRPISGDPRLHPEWNGMEAETCGLAASCGQTCHWPYVLHFMADDRRGRLQRNDHVLISQGTKNNATVFVLEKTDCFLARRKKPQGWEPLSTNRRDVAEANIVGYVAGIVWAAL